MMSLTIILGFAALDALWDTASAVAEGAINVNPAEATKVAVPLRR